MISVIGIVLALAAYHIAWISERKQFVRSYWLHSSGDGPAPWSIRILAAQGFKFMVFEDQLTDMQFRQCQELFPEAYVEPPNPAPGRPERLLLENLQVEIRTFRAGDKVIKNAATWIPSDFDGWGAGNGVGEVLPLPDGWDDDGTLVNVRWPAGIAFQKPEELIPAT